MVRQPRKDIREVIKEVGKFPPDAFQFVQEGLSYTVHEMHGEMSDLERSIHQFMIDKNLDIDAVESLNVEHNLPDQIVELIDRAGGLEELNRHVSGQSLCWGLRDYAVQRWGAMASVVLRHWNIRQTRDFGEIVFALVENDFLQKQPGDNIDDFTNVFEFEEAFEKSFRIDLQESQN